MKTPSKIVLAAQDAIDTFEREVDHLLLAIDHQGALVTDETQLWDFTINIPGAEGDVEIVEINRHVMEAVSQVMDRPVGQGEYLWRLAQELHLRSQTTTLH